MYLQALGLALKSLPTGLFLKALAPNSADGAGVCGAYQLILPRTLGLSAMHSIDHRGEAIVNTSSSIAHQLCLGIT